MHEGNNEENVASQITYYHFCLGVASCGSCLIRLQDSLIINVSGKNQVISFLCMKLVIKGR